MRRGLVIWSLALMVVAWVGPSKLPFGMLTLAVAERGAHVVDVQPVGGERLRVELDAHRRPLPAADADQADAGLLRYLLRRARLAEIFQLIRAAGSSR